jgi:glycosyltransferase involved in cell wall biosynthesis
MIAFLESSHISKEFVTRILYFCHYFSPEIGAAQARLLEISRRWVEMGHEVKVVTCFPNYPDGIIPDEYRGKRYMVEEIDGIKVFRSWVLSIPHGGFFAKTIGYLSFAVSSMFQTLPRIGEVDIVIASSPPIFSIFSAYLFSRVKRVPFIFEIRDLWPAAIIELGALKNKWVIRALEAFEMFLYHHADKIIGVTDSFSRILTERGIDPSKLDTVTNGVDTEFFRPENRNNSVRSELGLDDKFVVLYLGTHGISQALSAQIDAAELLKDQADIQFLFVGEGAEKQKLAAYAAEKKLNNVVFLPNQPKQRVPEFYAAADICLAPLRNISLFDNFIPCKIFEIMSCGKPIVASLRGEAANIMQQGGAAIIVEPENSSEIAKAILSLKTNDHLRRQMAENGRALVISSYSRTRLAEQYAKILEKIVLKSMSTQESTHQKTIS